MSEQPTPRTDAAFKSIPGYTSHPTSYILDLASRLERELATASRHPSDEVNAKYIVPLQVENARLHAAGLAELLLRAENERLRAALVGIADVRTCGQRGRFLNTRSDFEKAADDAIESARAALANPSP